ncbi:tRNA (guanine(10)-N2)-methyltransferase homolog isoform X2 [Lineus longissimus]|uniref:tRNA (guanine(10)-N2)-methyltransferase homolog isoform X2 n=1 Tax=Lineus longissimus TaxID=88925 RepID=UPI002B4CE8E0
MGEKEHYTTFKMSAPMARTCRKYLFHFVNEHVEFRLPNPFLVVEIPSEESAKKVASRAVLVRSFYEVWATGKTFDGLIENLRLLPSEVFKPFLPPDKTFCINVETYNKTLSLKEKIKKIEELCRVLKPEGKVNLKTPDVTLQLFEYYKREGRDSAAEPSVLYAGRWVADGFRDGSRKRFSLKTRCFIGNTSMDPSLALIMANMGQVKDCDIVVDPFVGTGSLLVACAHFGGFVMGTDINYTLLHAKGKPSRHNQTKRAPDESVAANMKQYRLSNRYLDVILADAAKCNIYRPGLKFDAIITDPPYGLRESTRTIAPQKGLQLTEEEKTLWIPSKSKYELADIFRDLLNFAAKYLTIGGRLVYWMPVIRPDYKDSHLPKHPCLSLAANSEQILTMQIGRRLITMEKTLEYEENMQTYIEEDHFQDNVAFREKCFPPLAEKQLPRKVRKMERKRARRKSLEKEGISEGSSQAKGSRVTKDKSSSMEAECSADGSSAHAGTADCADQLEPSLT